MSVTPLRPPSGACHNYRDVKNIQIFQSARMSKITNDGLTRSGRMLYSCTHMATVGSKGLHQPSVNTPLVTASSASAVVGEDGYQFD